MRFWPNPDTLGLVLDIKTLENALETHNIMSIGPPLITKKIFSLDTFGARVELVQYVKMVFASRQPCDAPDNKKTKQAKRTARRFMSTINDLEATNEFNTALKTTNDSLEPIKTSKIF